MKELDKLAPCIISMAKYALNIKLIKPDNHKKCSKKYWINTIDLLLLEDRFKKFKDNRNEAIEKFDLVNSKYKG